MGSLTLKVLIGMAAGFLAWALIEPTAPPIQDVHWADFENRFLLAQGLLIGFCIGALQGLNQGGKIHALRGAGLGMLLGVIGIFLGHRLGGALIVPFGPGVFHGNSPFLITLFARTLALSAIGAMLGAGIGLSSLIPRRGLQGLLGGFLGGALAGTLFDPISGVLRPLMQVLRGVPSGQVFEGGMASRAVYGLLLGGGIALFIGIIERVSRQAWLRLSLGRNEGKEWSLDAAQTVIGRSESAAIPLFGDPAIQPFHAIVTRHNGAYFAADNNTPNGTLLNGIPLVGQVPLLPGAILQLGQTRLEFLMRGARPQTIPMMQPAVPGGMPQNVPVQGMSLPFQQAPPQNVTVQTPTFQPTVQTPAYRPMTLVALDGPLSGQRFEVHQPLELGRESQAISLAYDTQASRRHASLQPTGDALIVTDLGSTNGTYVNGQKISQPQSVSRGSVLKIGSTSFRIE